MKKLVVLRSVKIKEGIFEMKFGLNGIEGGFSLRNKNKVKYFEFDAIGNLLPSTLYDHIANTLSDSLEPVQVTLDEFETRIDTLENTLENALEGVLDARIYKTGTLTDSGEIISIPITINKSCKITGTVLLNDTGFIDFEVLCKCIAGTASVTLWNLDYSNAGTRTLVFGSSANEVSIGLNTSTFTKYKLGYDLNYLTL